MKVVKIIKDWKWPDLSRQSKDNNGQWDDYLFTEDNIKDYDYLAVLNRNSHDIDLPKLNIPKFLVSQEPPFHIWHKRSFKYFDKVFTQHPSRFFKNTVLSHGALPWYIEKSYNELRSIVPTTIDKKKTISCIASAHSKIAGHRNRLSFVNKLSESNLNIDIFGKGINELPDKFEGLFPYEYSIAIENSSYPHYWTEKIADCFLSYTMPFYYGCTNIASYFPEGSYVWIDIKRPTEALKTIEQSLNNGLWQKNFAALCEARDLILNKYQLLPFLAKKIEKYNGCARNINHIPANSAPWEKEYSLKEQVELKLLSYV